MMKQSARKTQASRKGRPAGRRANLEKLADVLQLVREDAKRKGLDKLTTREINAEIEAYRREKDPLYGQTRRITVVLSERLYREAKATAQSVSWDLSMLVRQAIGDYLEQLKHPRRTPNNIFDRGQRLRITKAIAESTKDFNTGRYET